MSRRTVEIRVGALLIVSLLVLFIGYTWYSDYRVGRSGYKVRVHFADVTGLLPGDDVRVAGVKKGKVESITLERQAVEVTLWLDSDVELFQDASFSILDVALISGTKYIAVTPGTTSVRLDLRKPSVGRPSGAFVMSSVADLSESLQDLLTFLRANLLTEEALAQTRETVENLNVLTKELTRILSDNRRNLTSGVKAFKSASMKLDSIVGSEQFAGTIARLDTLTQKLNSGEGSLSKMLNDPGAYDEMKGTLKAAKELLEDIKAHPRKYINLELF
jgi:phospholipid/cholesterol/gamma-HCH transport system substrate-binding protein